MDWNEVGRRIRTKRKEKKLRQEDLAEMVSLSTSYIGMIERGEKIPSLETFVYLANALDTPTDDLLSGVLDNGYKIRRAAIDLNIPLITNARLASAFINAFCTLSMDDIQIKSWQEY